MRVRTSSYHSSPLLTSFSDSTLACSASVARVLLIQFRWKAQTVLDRVGEEGMDALLLRAGVTSKSSKAERRAGERPLSPPARPLCTP